MRSNCRRTSPGQAIYLARNAMIGAYKDLTDVMPSKIGRPSKFAFPPAYFDADNEALLEEYSALFKAMQGPPGNAQDSATPFHDAVALGTAVGRAKGLDATHAAIAGRIVLGIFFAETGGVQNLGNARSGKYKGSYQTGVSEDRIGQKKWAAIKPSIAAFDPALNARDEKEQARVGKRDQRYNHWTGLRNGLMNAHADVFPQIPAIVKVLPDPLDQLRLFELIQIVPTPTRAAIRSGDLAQPPDFRAEDHGIPAQQQHVHLRQGRPGENLGDLPRNSGRHVAVQHFIEARARQVRRDRGRAEK